MSKLDELIKKYCPNGVPYLCLGEVGQVKMCKRILKSQTNDTSGVPFYKIGTFGKEAQSYISEELYNDYRNRFSYPKKGEILISAAGTIGRTVIYDGQPAYYQDSNIVWLSHDESLVLNTYLNYCYETKPWNISSGGTISRLYNNDLLNTKIPVPPLPVQEEIVRILDSFTLLTAELQDKLNTELQARKKQYEYYKHHLLHRSDKVVELASVAYYVKERINANMVDKTTYVGVDNLLQNCEGKVISNHVPTDGKLIKYMPNDILIGNIRPYLRKIWFADNIGGTNGDVLTIRLNDNSGTEPKYLYHVLSSDDFFIYDTNNAKGAKMPRGNKDAVMKYKFSVPTLLEQRKIADILEHFYAICNDITTGLPAEIAARQKQYEYYRDKLLTFKKLS